MSLELTYLYDASGRAVGFVYWRFVRDLHGNVIGQLNGHHVHALSGEYVGEFDGQMVVDKGLTGPTLPAVHDPGSVGPVKDPGRRAYQRMGWPDVFHRLTS